MTPHDSFRPNYNEMCYAGGQETNKESWSSNNFIYYRPSTLRVGLNVQWDYPELFGDDFILRLGGMHFLMSYVAGSVLEELMKAAFLGE